MHRIPRFFVPSQRRKSTDSNRKPRGGPRLDRLLAKKNIDYEPPSHLQTRSLDSCPFGDTTTSFRVQGIDGEIDLIFESLGLSGPDDFSIPTAAWEARKVRSLQQLESGGDIVSGVAENQNDSPGGDDDFGELLRVEVDDFTGNHNDSLDESSRGGIRGVRPPVLAQPPSISRPVIDDRCSTWDILRPFAPDSDEDGEIVSGEEVIGVRLGCLGLRLGGRETRVLYESCSFTTASNDDDSSSTTTEAMSSISPNGRFRRTVTSWQKGDLLGRGSFGSVYEGIADGGFFFAVKEVSLLDQGDQGRQSVYQLEQEIALLSQFEHENIVRYYGTDKDGSKLYIFLELITRGSLLNLYLKYHLQDSQVSSYTRQILHGLKYLHERNVVHRDIKCANILVGDNGSVKLADFGLAKATKLNDVKSCKGTAFWMAPEVVNRRNQGYGLAADIWSLGCTVLEMLTRQIPYSPLECMQALFRIGMGEPPPVPDSLSRDARDFILKCLQVYPSARPTAAQLLDHPFVKPLPISLGSSSPYNSGSRV